MCNFSLSNVLHNNKKALIKTGTLTTLVMDIKVILSQDFFLFKNVFFLAFSE